MTSPPTTLTKTLTNAMNIEVTPEPNDFTPIPTQTQTMVVTEPVPVIKVESINSLPEIVKLPGFLLFQKSNRQGLYTYEPHSDQIKQLKNTNGQIISFGYSPDNRWLAFTQIEPRPYQDKILLTPKIILSNSPGNQLEKDIDFNSITNILSMCCADKPNIGLWYGEWITNDLLYIEIQVGDNNGGLVGVIPMILNPFTMTWKTEYFSRLPNLYTNIFGRIKSHEIKISPDLSRILYPLENGGIALFDTNSSTLISKINDFPNKVSEIIEWSGDSQFVAIASIPGYSTSMELIILSRIGEEKLIANELYPVTGLLVSGLRWSPNGKFLGIRGKTIGSDGVVAGESIFLVYDMDLEDFILALNFADADSLANYMTWSPDSQWVTLSAPDNDTRIIDVVHQEIYFLSKVFSVIAWNKECTEVK